MAAAKFHSSVALFNHNDNIQIFNTRASWVLAALFQVAVGWHVYKQLPINEWMGMDYWWNATVSGKPKSSLKNHFPFHSVHHKHEQAWDRTLASWWEAGD
jgi:hypothetical protein